LEIIKDIQKGSSTSYFDSDTVSSEGADFRATILDTNSFTPVSEALCSNNNYDLSFGMRFFPVETGANHTHTHQHDFAVALPPRKATNEDEDSTAEDQCEVDIDGEDPKQLRVNYEPEPWDVASKQRSDWEKRDSVPSFLTRSLSDTMLPFVLQLCGRGEKYFDYVGNRRLRILIACRLSSYMHAKHRFERSSVLSQVVRAVYDSGGRFLRQDKDTGRWFVVTGMGVIRKVCHVINYSWSRSTNNEKGLTLDEKIQATQDHLVFTVLRRRRSGVVVVNME
jgi:hypothetical protein